MAWAHARAGERKAAEQALGAVEHWYEHSRPENEPEWIYWLNEDEINVMAGRCYVELGVPGRAVPLLSDAPVNYPDDRTRELALYTSWLAEALIMLGNVGEAVSHATRALELTSGTASTRSDERIEMLLNKLNEYRDLALVRDFAEYARALEVVGQLPRARVPGRPGTVLTRLDG